MNANEVIANLATKFSGISIDPNDDVNMSQSSNDVILAIKVSAFLDISNKLYPALDKLISTIEVKANSIKGSVKTGRTHLMDAMPIDFSQEQCMVVSIKASRHFLLEKRLLICHKGTAVGTGINAHPRFSKYLLKSYQSLLEKVLSKTSDFSELAQDTVQVSKENLKIANFNENF